MSNLRSDCRDLVKDREPGDTWKVHIQALCNQVDTLEERLLDANQRLIAIRGKLEEAVCTKEPDMGVVLLDQYAPTHSEVINGETFGNVYDLEYFSPLGEALIAAWKKAEPVSLMGDYVSTEDR